MADLVLGKKMVLSALRPGEEAAYYPFACAQEVGLRVSTEMLPSTHPESGAWEAVRPRRNSWALNLTGILFLRDLANPLKWMGPELILEQVRQTGQHLKIIWTDEGGYVRTFTGFAYIPESDITGIAGQISKWSCQWQGSGDFAIDVPPITIQGTNMRKEFWPIVGAVGAETFYQHTDLIGRTIQQVSFEGIGDHLEIITSGSPTAQQVKYTTGSGRLDWIVNIFPGSMGHTLFN